MALALYDRHVPFFDGTVEVRDVNLQVFAVGESNLLRDGVNRHQRMLPWRKIDWYVAAKEPIKFVPPEGVNLRRIPENQKIAQMLENGEIDALVTPRPPMGTTTGAAKIRRLFIDSPDEERRYFLQAWFFSGDACGGFQRRIGA